MSTRSTRENEPNQVRVPEKELYEPVSTLPLFRAQMVRMAREVSFGRKRVDLVGVTARGDLIAVEFKVSDWRRVLWQASINQLFADFSYVAVWHTALKFLDLTQLRQKGIGVISISGVAARTVRRALRSPIQSPVHRAAVLEQLQEPSDDVASSETAAAS